MHLLSKAADSLFAPVSASRPFLLEKFVLVLLAADIWSTRTAGASRYDADEFQLAHFGWLDALQPTPNETIYIGSLVLTGLLSVTLAVANLGLAWRLALVVLYSYTWAMSRLDSYQHHYLLSWVLLCVAFFPTLRLADVANTEKGRPLACAWAWRLLGLLIAVVYVWTSIAKLDDVWRGGAGLAQLSGAKNLLNPFAALFPGRLGVYAFAANATIVVELIIAAGYAVAALATDRSGRFTQLLCWVSWVLAIALHAGFELAGLKIGWFSYWMIAAACVYFLPDNALWAIVDRLSFVMQSLQNKLPQPIEASSPSRTPVLAVVAAVVTATAVYAIDLPGVGAACACAWATLAGYWFVSDRTTTESAVAGLLLGVALLHACMWVHQPQSQFYTYRLAQLQRRGDWEAARGCLPKAEKHADPDDLFAQFNLGWFLAVADDAELRDAAKATRYAARASELAEHQNATALDAWACALASGGDYQAAVAKIDQAAKLLRPGDPLRSQLAQRKSLFLAEQPYVLKPRYRYRTPSSQ